MGFVGIKTPCIFFKLIIFALYFSHMQVVIPLHQLKAVNPSTSKVKAAEKYIQVISVDNHEFWFMSFVNYDSAVKHLQEAVQLHPQPHGL